MLTAEMARDEANKELLRAASRAAASEAGAQRSAQLQHEVTVRYSSPTHASSPDIDLVLELFVNVSQRLRQLLLTSEKSTHGMAGAKWYRRKP